MKVTATWTGGMRFRCDTDTGHTVVAAAPAQTGGGTDPSPVEMVLSGLAACTAIDVVSILERMRVPPRSLEVVAQAERAEAHPRIFTRIHLVYRVAGEVPRDKLERAVTLSERTYCSVGAMLASTAAITHELLIEP